jgi:hypothetical protein
MDVKQHKNNDIIVSNKLQEYVDKLIHTDVLRLSFDVRSSYLVPLHALH